MSCFFLNEQDYNLFSEKSFVRKKSLNAFLWLIGQMMIEISLRSFQEKQKRGLSQNSLMPGNCDFEESLIVSGVTE